MNITQQIVNAIWLGSVYSLFALGYALIFSVLGVLNLAHSAIFMWGAFIGLIAVTQVNLPLWLSVPLAMIGAGLISVILERVAFAPLRKRNAPRISQLISSIGASILLVSLAQLVFGTNPQRFPIGTIPTDAIEGLPFRVTPIQVVILVVAVVLMALLQYLVMRTRIGQRMRSLVGVGIRSRIDGAHDAGGVRRDPDHGQYLVAGNRQILFLELHPDDRGIGLERFVLA